MEKEFVERATGALADRYRLAVVLALSQAETLSFAKVQELMGLSQPCVSHHLKILADSGLITSQKQGRCVEIQLNRGALQELAGFLGRLGELVQEKQRGREVNFPNPSKLLDESAL